MTEDERRKTKRDRAHRRKTKSTHTHTHLSECRHVTLKRYDDGKKRKKEVEKKKDANLSVSKEKKKSTCPGTFYVSLLLLVCLLFVVATTRQIYTNEMRYLRRMCMNLCDK